MITDITSKMLHEKTGQVLDRLRRGERFRVLRAGEPEGFIVLVEEAIDPEWPDIMAEVSWRSSGPVTPSKGFWHPPQG